VKRPFSETLTEDARAENPKTHPWKRYLRYLKWYGIGVVVVAIILASVGYSGAGWEGVKNGLTWAGLFTLFGLPVAGLFINITFWSGYANRWGEYIYKKELEGEAKSNEEDY
jgi:predicted PurR-regulated permease PerM